MDHEIEAGLRAIVEECHARFVGMEGDFVVFRRRDRNFTGKSLRLFWLDVTSEAVLQKSCTIADPGVAEKPGKPSGKPGIRRGSWRDTHQRTTGSERRLP
jgi:hypothetical protein